MILTLRTDKPEAEVGLFKPGGSQISYYTWLAHRSLAKDLLKVIKQQLEKAGSNWEDIEGIVVFKGPGSFTGLRIGITVANTIAYGQEVPVIGEVDKDWAKRGLERLKNSENDKIVLPFYGSEANITLPRT